MESNNPINENQQMQIDTDPPQNIPISPNALNRWAGQNEQLEFVELQTN